MSDLENSEYYTDEESDLQDLKQLNAAISELNNDEPCMSTSLQHEPFIPVADDGSASAYTKYAQVDTAIALNKECDEKIRRLEGVLQKRLIECRRRLAELQDNPDSERIDKTEKFSFVNFGKPYFKDKRGFPAPDNEDTILMKSSQMYNFSCIASVPGWTVKDKCQLSMLIHKMSKEIKKKKLHSQILALQRENKLLKSTKNNKRILQLKKEVVNVNKESLEALALPMDEEYDWDYIANKLSNRHSANEYRSLWKLFLHPSINKNIWTKSEHLSLQKIALEKKLQDWDNIAKELDTGRTNYQCFVYFRTNMNNTFTSRKWTREEEEYLKRLIDYYREENYIPWGKVAASMENRTKVQVYNKHARLSELRKGKFLTEEDSVILTCVNIFGPNFRKITEYLQGRSVTQCRERYNVLIKRKYSTVWTINEDRKLVTIMANQDATTNFSTVSKYFPGKDRVHVRSRYLTLARWIRRNPNADIKYAPRRSARRLGHGKSTDDLNRAMENLKKRLETEIIAKKKSKITMESPPEVIDEALLAQAVTEHTKIMEVQKIRKAQAVQDAGGVETGENKNIDVSMLAKVLLLLKAKLNKARFENSTWRTKYPSLYIPEAGPNSVHIRSYSKKNPVKKLKVDTKMDIWGRSLTKPLLYVLPPHFATVTACKQLMSYYMTFKTDSEETKNLNILIKKNMLIKGEVATLMERFNSLLLWPMLLSNTTPEECKKDAEKNAPTTSKSGRKFPIFDEEHYNIALPVASTRKRTLKDDQNNIDLMESEDSHKIEVDETYFDSIN